MTTKNTPKFSDKENSDNIESGTLDNDPSRTVSSRKEGTAVLESNVTTNSSPEADEDYVYVTMPDGSTRAVSRRDVQAAQKRDADSYAAGVAVANEAPQEEFYVHLADGSVERCKTSELPPQAGTNALNGYWDRDGYTHHVIGVYPVETKNPEGN